MAEKKKARKRVSRLKVTSRSPRETAIDAYVYGYPLVLLDVTQQVMTNVARPGGDGAPVNRLLNRRSFPDANFKGVVSPNADTLYTSAFLDLEREPMVLSVPYMGQRYYLMQMLDAWTNVFASLGTRTTGNGKGDFAITGPSWKGNLPLTVLEVNAPTNKVWILGRTETHGTQDYAAVHAIQDRYRLIPLSSFGRLHALPRDASLNPAIDMTTPPVDQVAGMGAAAFFGRLNALMVANPPAHDDAVAIRRFSAVGIAPGKPFSLDRLRRSVARELEGSAQEGQQKIAAEAQKPHGKIVNGWRFMMDLGHYGTHYMWRAVVARVGLGANLPDDAIYPHATTDANGDPLTGAHQYEIRFAKGELPPVNAFWSITMYNSEQFFVRNAINRYAIGDRDKLKFDADGSLTLHIQRTSPGKDREANWLPAPSDGFNLMMRLYWPKEEILEGGWKPPRIELKEARHRKIA